jgi:hypothetical protein
VFIARMLMGGEKDAHALNVFDVDSENMNERLKKAIDVPQMLLPYYS